jgi:hypothetical protein
MFDQAATYSFDAVADLGLEHADAGQDREHEHVARLNGKADRRGRGAVRRRPGSRRGRREGRMTRAPGRTAFRSVLGVAEFRALWAAELCSVAGDQFARVALAVIVFTRTESAGWTAATYALSLMPAFLGEVLLGGLGDRCPRREVMVASDLVRAMLVALMALPGMPLAVLCALVAAVTFVGGPFKAAQQSLLPDVLAGDTIKYTVGQSLRTATGQAAQSRPTSTAPSRSPSVGWRKSARCSAWPSPTLSAWRFSTPTSNTTPAEVMVAMRWA